MDVFTFVALAFAVEAAFLLGLVIWVREP